MSKRTDELRARYLEQRDEFVAIERQWIAEGRTEVLASEVCAEQRRRGRVLLTSAELSELYDALPNDRREPTPPAPPAVWWVRAFRWVFGQHRMRGGPWE